MLIYVKLHQFTLNDTLYYVKLRQWTITIPADVPWTNAQTVFCDSFNLLLYVLDMLGIV